MKRLLVLLTVVALIVVMLAMAVGPAFAASRGSYGAKDQDLAHRDPFSIRACTGVV